MTFTQVSSPITEGYDPTWKSAVLPRYASAPNWNDYARTDGVACNAAYDTACEHGGEQRSVTVPQTSCAGLSMTDVLHAFDWYCDDTGGNAVFTSRLKFDKGLAQLIDTTNNVFLDNGVTYYINSVPQGSSAQAKWWSNPIEALTGTNSAQLNLPVASLSVAKIYILNTGTFAYTGGFNINADKIAVVIAPSTTLAWSMTSVSNNVDTSTGEVGSPNNAKAVLAAGAQNYIWLEGALNGNSYSNYGIFLRGVKFANLRRLNLSLNLLNGVDFESSNSGRLTNVTSTGNAQNGIYFNASNYNLLSGVFAANNMASGFSFNFSNSNRLSAIFSSSNAMYGIHFNNSSSNIGSDLKAANNTSAGMMLFQSNQNKLSKIKSYNNGSYGINLASALSNSFTDTVSASNGNFGLQLTDSSYNHFLTIIAANNSNSGMQLATTSSNNIISQYAATNNYLDGLWITESANNNTVSQVAFSRNDYGFFVGSSTAANNKLTGNILVGNNNTNCYNIQTLSNQTGGPVDTTCANNSISNSSVFTNINIDLANSFVTKITSDLNPSNSSGTALYNSFLDWFKFDNFFRLWGKDGSSFPALDNRGRCSTGTCRIWDWSLKTADAVIRNMSAMNSGGITPNSAFTAQNTCPSEVAGSEYIESVDYTMNAPYVGGGNGIVVTNNIGPANVCDLGDVCHQRYLKNAVEMIVDGIGNGDDDGLCETGENCLYTPNFGAYQGHGTLAECTFNPNYDPWPIMNVKMFGYTSNGY